MAKRRAAYTRTKLFRGMDPDEVVASATNFVNKEVNTNPNRDYIGMSISVFYPENESSRNRVHVLVSYTEHCWENC